MITGYAAFHSKFVRYIIIYRSIKGTLGNEEIVLRITRTLGVLVASVLSTTSVGTLTAMAATQAQSQGLSASQAQEIDTTGTGTVYQGQTSVLTSQQTQKTGTQTSDQATTNESFVHSNQDHSVTGQTQYSQKQKSTVSSKMNKSVSTSVTLYTTNASAKSVQHGTFHVTGKASVSQTSTTTILGIQSQQVPSSWTMTQAVESAAAGSGAGPSGARSGSNSSSSSGSGSGPESGLMFSSVYSSSSTFGSISSVTHVTFGSQTNPIVSHVAVAGYAVFDLAGNRISNNFGGSGTGNATGHYDQFQPNQPVVLILRPVDANGNPVQSLNPATVYLKSSNSSSRMTVYGNTFSALLLNPGSYGVPFVYTNTGNTPSYDVIDPTNGPKTHHHSPNLAQTALLKLSQTEKVTTTAAVTAQQAQATGTQSQQSQDSGSHQSGSSTLQNQKTNTSAGATLKQTQTTDVTTNEAQSSSTTSGSNGSVNINLQQAQSVQSSGTGTATESQGTSFAAQDSMQIHFGQSQQSSTSDALQSEGIHVSASNPNGSTSTGGTLSVYLNGHLKGQYSGVTGTVTASQSQTTGTGSSSSNQESNQVSYEQDGQTVTVNIQ